MKKILLLLAFTTIFLIGKSQDLTEISRDLIGKKTYQIKSIFKELNLFYYQHMQDKKEAEIIVLTIEDGNGVSFMAKLYISTDMTIKKIIINFSHDNSSQIKALLALSNYDDFHVGNKSTDIFYY